jgi:hypothetical protein
MIPISYAMAGSTASSMFGALFGVSDTLLDRFSSRTFAGWTRIHVIAV